MPILCCAWCSQHYTNQQKKVKIIIERCCYHRIPTTPTTTMCCVAASIVANWYPVQHRVKINCSRKVVVHANSARIMPTFTTTKDLLLSINKDRAWTSNFPALPPSPAPPLPGAAAAGSQVSLDPGQLESMPGSLCGMPWHFGALQQRDWPL